MATPNSAPNSVPITKQKMAAGYVAPYIGRVAHSDVAGPFGMLLIKKGDVITQTTADRALSMGRLFELIASSEAQAH